LKSPIKEKPLRNPGESLDQQLNDLINDKLLVYFMASTLAITFCISEWFKWYTKSPPKPILMSVIAVFVLIVSFWKFREALGQAKRLNRGREGEKAIGQFLEINRPIGAQVFHDIPGDGFNLDHVIIHNSGVYVIETKTLSKPDKGQTVLEFDGHQVLKNGFELDRDPVVQVKAGANWIKQLMKKSTGRDIPVKPVVLFPGWYIQPKAGAKGSEVWVLNEKALFKFIDKRPAIMKEEDVYLCSFHLGQYIRSK
jgi:hypothetical protein